MTDYATSAWETKLRKRRAIRDHYRTKFFRDHGFSQRLTDPFDTDLSPSQQIAKVRPLLDKAKETVEGETSALSAMTDLMSGMDFGNPIMAVTAIGRPTLKDQTVTNFIKRHFFMSLRGW